MSPQELNLEVAHATGECVRTIAKIGFVLLTANPYEGELDRDPLTVDWDDLERKRQVVLPAS